MRALILMFLTLVLILMVGSVLVWKSFGFWGLAALFLSISIMMLGLKMLAGRMLRTLFLTPFKMKGRVLRGAEVTVHEIVSAGRPVRENPYLAHEEDDEEEDDDYEEDEEDRAHWQQEWEQERAELEERDARREWFLIDLTVTPPPASGEGFTLWEPDELLLVDVNSDPQQALDSDEDEEVAEVFEVAVWNEDAQSFDTEFTEGKLFGPQRLKMHVGVERGYAKLALRYYFEQFGEVSLPLAHE